VIDGLATARDDRWMPPTRALVRPEDVDAPGEPRTLEEIFALVERQVASLVHRRRGDFDDLLQAANEAVLRALPRFEGRSRLSTFTYQICYFTVSKRARANRRWARRFEHVEEGSILDAAADRTHTARSPEALVHLERLRRLRAAVPRLSEKKRIVVTLHDLEGRTVDEIADIIGVSALTVRSRLRDGRKQLAHLLAGDPYFGDLEGS
jgi:RNA polymerase sigma-70 factor (ECF subfamily)